MSPSREQQLEDEVELLRQQLSALTGSPKELGALMALRYGMTQRLAQILHILVKRAPATVSRNAFHALFYGDRDDGGPEPKIFAVHVTRLRKVLTRLHAEGKIDTVWNSGWRANPELVDWVQSIYNRKIKEK